MRKRSVVILGLGTLLALTPYYSLSFLAAIIVAADWRLLKSSFFDSYFTRFVTSFLILCAYVMLIGMYAWIAHVNLHPLYVFIPFALTLFIGQRYAPSQTGQDKAFSREDLLAVGLAAVGIVVLLVSFYVPKPSLGSNVQIITNGFDNAAHLSLIETTYRGDGYVYGKYETIKDQIAWRTLTAYPQGWHLANSFIWKGTGLPYFSTPDLSLALSSYVITLLTWLFIALFLLNKTALYIVRLLGRKKSIRDPASVAAYVALGLVVQVAVYWGSLYFGFVTFIGALAYFMLLITLLLATQGEKGGQQIRLFILSIICVAAIGLSWLLPIFIAGAMVALVFGLLVNKRLIKQAKVNTKLSLSLLATTIIVAIPALAIILVSRSFSEQGQSQINDEGGIFNISITLVLLASIFTVYVMLSSSAAKRIQNVFIAAIAPTILFIGVIYLYQMFTIGHTAYFFVKCLALLVGLLGVFLIAAGIYKSDKIKFAQQSALYTVVTILMIVTGVVVFSGQDMTGAKHLLQRNSQMAPAVAQAFANLAQDGQLKTRNVIVFTKVSPEAYGGDVTGNVLSTALNTKIEHCIGDSIWLITDHRSAAFPAWINSCAVSDKQKITVITSSETYGLIKRYNNPHINVVLAQ